MHQPTGLAEISPPPLRSWLVSWHLNLTLDSTVFGEDTSVFFDVWNMLNSYFQRIRTWLDVWYIKLSCFLVVFVLFFGKPLNIKSTPFLGWLGWARTRMPVAMAMTPRGKAKTKEVVNGSSVDAWGYDLWCQWVVMRIHFECSFFWEI